MLDGLGGPLVARTRELIGEIEAGRRVCEVANLELLAAHARMEAVPALNAVITPLAPSERAATGPLHGVVVAVKDNIDVRGVVTTNASTVCVPPPAAQDAAVVVRLRDAGAELLCKTNLLEYAAGSVNPAYGMTYNPHRRDRTSGGSSSGSARSGGRRRVSTTRSARTPAARSASPRPTAGSSGVKPTFGLVPEAGVTALSPDPRPRGHADPHGRAGGGAAGRPGRAAARR